MLGVPRLCTTLVTFPNTQVGDGATEGLHRLLHAPQRTTECGNGGGTLMERIQFVWMYWAGADPAIRQKPNLPPRGPVRKSCENYSFKLLLNKRGFLPRRYWWHKCID